MSSKRSSRSSGLPPPAARRSSSSSATSSSSSSSASSSSSPPPPSAAAAKGRTSATTASASSSSSSSTPVSDDESIGAVGEEEERAANKLVVSALDRELAALRDGSHCDFVEGVKELLEVKQDQLREVEYIRRTRMKSVSNQYKAGKKQVNEEFEESKKRLQDNLIEVVSEKRRRLDLGGKLPAATPATTRRKARGGRVQGGRGAGKKELTFQRIKFSLSVDDATHDLSLMRRPFAPHGGQVSVDTEKEVLYYYAHELKPGDRVTVARRHGVSFDGVLSSVSKEEIFVRRSDETDCRVFVAQLVGGSWAISPR